MRCDDLTPEQAHQIWQSVGRYNRYLNNLRLRMEQMSFPSTDRLYIAVLLAMEINDALSMKAAELAHREAEGRAR